MVKHPAKFSDKMLPTFAKLLAGQQRILDPMAGTGKLANVLDWTMGEIWTNDLEPEWVSQAPAWAKVTVADASRLPFLDGYFTAICTSPPYATRLADHHNAKDGSKRNGYKFALGRDLTFGNTGNLQWGKLYCYSQKVIWQECRRVLAPGGLFVLNISDHIRRKKRIRVSLWHRLCLRSLGFELVEEIKIETPRLRYGANAKARVPYESILVFKRGE